MNVSFALYRRLAWLNLPGALLIALLQRTPVLRVLAGAGNQVAVSPAGQLMRGVLTAAALGSMHSRAGATTFVVSPDTPIPGRVGTPLSAAFTYTGTPSSPASFQVKGGSLPPGMNFIPAPVGGTIRSGNPAISGTPTTAGTFTVFVQGFNPEGLTNNVDQPITFQITGGVTTVAPSITTQPQNQTVNVGASVTFSVAASGEPTPTYQWRRNSQNIAGATSASLQLTNVQTSDAGTYSVVVSNSAGAIASNNVTLTVNTPNNNPLAITADPLSQTVATGSTVVFNVGANNATGFQWQRNGAALAGATSATLVITNASAANAGDYRVVVSGAGGATATSGVASLVVANQPDFGRLINLSILTSIPSAGADFTMGYVVGGGGTNGAKPLVIRAAGPSLGALGVPGTLGDPKMEVFAGSAKTGENDNWGGSASLTAALAAVGAFAYTGPTSLDAAMSVNITSRDNSVKVSGNAGGTGSVIAEIYDATPSGSFNASTPRLINVSVSKVIDATGSNAKLTAGFVIGGSTSRTVLIRAVGPGLAAVGLTSGFVNDPTLTLFAGSTKAAENDNWGGDAQIVAAAASVGAFTIPPSSRDAVLLVTLSPGQYSADVSGIGGGGLVLVEVYEVP